MKWAETPARLSHWLAPARVGLVVKSLGNTLSWTLRVFPTSTELPAALLHLFVRPVYVKYVSCKRWVKCAWWTAGINRSFIGSIQMLEQVWFLWFNKGLLIACENVVTFKRVQITLHLLWLKNRPTQNVLMALKRKLTIHITYFYIDIILKYEETLNNEIHINFFKKSCILQICNKIIVKFVSWVCTELCECTYTKGCDVLTA